MKGGGGREGAMLGEESGVTQCWPNGSDLQLYYTTTWVLVALNRRIQRIQRFNKYCARTIFHYDRLIMGSSATITTSSHTISLIFSYFFRRLTSKETSLIGCALDNYIIEEIYERIDATRLTWICW